MIDIREALYAGASAGDDSLTDGAISRDFRAVPTERRERAFRQSLKRFAEALPEDTSVGEILEAIDRLESIDDETRS